jgi:serine protease Do
VDAMNINKLALGILLLSTIVNAGAQAAVLLEPTDEFLHSLKQSMVKIGTTTKSGGHGFGTGIAISKDQVVTNCHVLGGANGVSISKWGTEYPVDSLQADWEHDLCILKVEYADLKPVTMGDSSKLSYEQPIISISMPNDSPAPYVALSTIKALYPLDDVEVIRTQAAFSIGASGSPIFDYDGKLIGVSTFKSPGKKAYFYNMPVNLVKAVMQTPLVKLNSPHDLPFWDAPDEARPFFMQIVLPFQNNRWQDVQKVASHWVEKEPNNAEAWYYMGEAAQHLGDGQAATMHYQKALSLHPNHPATLQATALLAKRDGKQEETNKIRITLREINPQLLEDLDSAAQAECLASTKTIEC